MRTLKYRSSPLVLATSFASLLVGALAFAQEPQPAPAEKARLLFDQMERGELDRQIASKQKEIDRLKEDQAKTLSDTNGLQKTVESTTALLEDSGENLSRLTGENRRLEHELAVSEAKAEAEKLKIEGLKALNVAQTKTLAALARRTEEAEARAHLRLAELDLLNAGKAIPKEGSNEAPQSDLAKARKALAQAETRTQAEDRAAREAMKDASAKMAAAEAKNAIVQRLVDNDLTVPLPAIAEKPKAKSTDKAKAPEKSEGDPSLRRAQVSRAPAPVAAPPSSSTASTDSRKPAKPFVPIFKR